MKRLAVLLLLIVGLIITFSFVAAQGLPGSGWTSGQQIQNIGTDEGIISFQAYDRRSLHGLWQPDIAAWSVIYISD